MDWETEGLWAEYEILEDWREQLDEVRDTADDWQDADDSDREVLSAFVASLPSVAAARREELRRDRLGELTGCADHYALPLARRVSSPAAEWNAAASAVGIAGAGAWALSYVASHRAEGAYRAVVACADCVAAYGPAAVVTGNESARWVPVLVDPVSGAPAVRWQDGYQLHAAAPATGDHPAVTNEAGAAPSAHPVARGCDFCEGVTLINPSPLTPDQWGGIDPAGSARAYALLDYCANLANLGSEARESAFYYGRRLREALMDRPGVSDTDTDRIAARFRPGTEIEEARGAWLGLAAFVAWDMRSRPIVIGGPDVALEASYRRIVHHWLDDAEAWTIIDTEVLETCCGESVEWDCPTCPDCQAPNPVMRGGLI